MEIIGEGHGGIVVADSAGAVKKFYLVEANGINEQQQLSFLGSLKGEGLSIGCTIPKLLEVVGAGNWKIDGKAYVYCNRMERVPGTSARAAILDFDERQTKRLGEDLGKIIFALHTRSKTYVRRWQSTFGDKDKLLAHILGDKAGLVMREEPDRGVNARVKKAASYLEDKLLKSASANTLSHADFTLSNTQVDGTGHVHGLVDWGDFTVTNPSLSLYQLADRPVWPHVKRQYEQLGGSIREDIAYAASAINLAWAPIFCKRIGAPLEEEYTQEYFEAMYAQFETHALG